MDSRQPLDFEQPVSREDICQRIEGLQIARVDHVPGELNPYDGPVVGFEFTNSYRLAIMAAPDLREGSVAPWVLKLGLFIDPNFIWSATPIKHLTRDRGQANERKPGWYQERVEGEVVEHIRILPEITAWGGEQMFLVLKGAGATLFRATPPPPGTRYSSGIWFQHYPQSRLTDLPRILTP